MVHVQPSSSLDLNLGEVRQTDGQPSDDVELPAAGSDEWHSMVEEFANSSEGKLLDAALYGVCLCVFCVIACLIVELRLRTCGTMKRM